MPAVMRLQDALGVIPPLDQLRPVGVGERVPHVADRLALHAGDVAEHLADRDAVVFALGHEHLDRVVKAELALISQRHHEHSGERLGDGSNQELGVRIRWRVRRRDVGRADALAPGQRAVPNDSANDAGHPVLGLAVEQDAPQSAGGRIGERGHIEDSNPGSLMIVRRRSGPAEPHFGLKN